MCDESDGTISPKYLGLIGGRCAQEKWPLSAASLAVSVGAVDNPEKVDNFQAARDNWTAQALGGATALLRSAADHLASGADLPLKELIERVSAPVERSVLLQVLLLTQYNKAKASRILHVDYKTLHKKLKEHSITTAQSMKE